MIIIISFFDGSGGFKTCVTAFGGGGFVVCGSFFCVLLACQFLSIQVDLPTPSGSFYWLEQKRYLRIVLDFLIVFVHSAHYKGG